VTFLSPAQRRFRAHGRLTAKVPTDGTVEVTNFWSNLRDRAG
jgi:hypothetical protein